jgi:hypothetical protein
MGGDATNRHAPFWTEFVAKIEDKMKVEMLGKWFRQENQSRIL